MVKRSLGYRSRSRSLLSKHPRQHGLRGLSTYLINYNIGDKVIIKIDPSTHKGAPHRRYHGKTGTIIGKRGRAYIVGIQVGSKFKKIIARCEHLSPHHQTNVLIVK
ncbi:MAG: 50S ribosomal protein L21e [Candidatus Methanomethylicia archaeon]